MRYNSGNALDYVNVDKIIFRKGGVRLSQIKNTAARVLDFSELSSININSQLNVKGLETVILSEEQKKYEQGISKSLPKNVNIQWKNNVNN